MKNKVENLGVENLIVEFYQHWSCSKNQSQVLNEAVLEYAAAW